jgi:hypothetical protein
MTTSKEFLTADRSTMHGWARQSCKGLCVISWTFVPVGLCYEFYIVPAMLNRAKILSLDCKKEKSWFSIGEPSNKLGNCVTFYIWILPLPGNMIGTATNEPGHLLKWWFTLMLKCSWHLEDLDIIAVVVDEVSSVILDFLAWWIGVTDSLCVTKRTWSTPQLMSQDVCWSDDSPWC